MKILVRATNWVGDAIMSRPRSRRFARVGRVPKFRSLRCRGLPISCAASPSADRVIVFDRAGRHAGFSGRERLAAELRRERFDAAVLFQNAFDAAWIAWRAGIPERIGYARDGRRALLTRAVSVPAKGEIPAPESFYYLELLRRAGWLAQLPARVEIALRIESSAREAAEAKLASAGSRKGALRCAMAPGAAFGAARCWPPERYGKLASELRAQSGAEVILLPFSSRSSGGEVKAGAAEPPDRHESIKRRIDEKQLPPTRQSARPRTLEPAQINRQPQRQENDRVPPIAALFWIDDCGLPQ